MHLSTPLAVDLPGRRYHPADLAAVSVDDWVASLCGDIAAAGLDDVVLVAHSSGGYVLPGCTGAPDRRATGRAGGHATRAGVHLRHGAGRRDESGRLPARRRLPPWPWRPTDAMVARAAGTTIGGLRAGEPPIETELAIVENGPRMGVEAPRLLEPVSWAGFPTGVSRTFVRCRRDKVIPPELADQMVANMGGATVVDFDGGHRSYETHAAGIGCRDRRLLAAMAA